VEEIDAFATELLEEWNDEDTKTLITFYGANPCPWDPSFDDYKNIIMKNTALSELCEQLKFRKNGECSN